MSDDMTHGERRLGLLTSSRAHVIMRGSRQAWEKLRAELWTQSAHDFDQQVKTGARGWGHEHEAEGAAKFWERHPEYEVQPGDFHPYQQPGHPLHGWLGSSPDRKLLRVGLAQPHGLEIKSPTSAENYDKHRVANHYDQCQHGMLCTRWPAWWLVVHYGELYKEECLLPDLKWQAEYLRKAALFWRLTYEDQPVKRRRLSATDL